MKSFLSSIYSRPIVLSAVFVAVSSLGVAVVGVAQGAPEPASEDPRLVALEQSIRHENARLLAIRQEVSEAEARAETARAIAEFQACRAQVKEIRAETERRRALCAKEVADSNLCMAQNSQRTAEGGLLGCGVGIVASAVTGGAAAPWALGGCALGVGAGAAGADACPVVTCSIDLENHEKDILEQRGLSAMPQCGGYAGLELAALETVADYGLVVNRVLPGTYANSVSMAAGDVIVQVNGSPVPDVAALDAVLKTVTAGQPLSVSVIRNRERFEFLAPASRNRGDGTLAAHSKLGIEPGLPVQGTSYRTGVEVRRVVSDSPAAEAGVRPGDVVLELRAPGDDAKGAQKVDRIAAIEAFLEDSPPAAEVALLVSHGTERAERRIRLRSRAGRLEL